MRAKDETKFTSASTNHQSNPNGPAGLPLMSKEGEKLANASAPSSAFKVRDGMKASGADKAMRGGR